MHHIHTQRLIQVLRLTPNQVSLHWFPSVSQSRPETDGRHRRTVNSAVGDADTHTVLVSQPEHPSCVLSYIRVRDGLHVHSTANEMRVDAIHSLCWVGKTSAYSDELYIQTFFFFIVDQLVKYLYTCRNYDLYNNWVTDLLLLSNYKNKTTSMFKSACVQGQETKFVRLVSECEPMLQEALTTDLPVSAVRVILPVSSICSNCA